MNAPVERLKRLFAAYFHEDWLEEADTSDGVLELFLKEPWTSEDLHEFSQGVLDYIAMYADEKVLSEAMFRELGCYYEPAADGLTARSWLNVVAARLEKEARSRAASGASFKSG